MRRTAHRSPVWLVFFALFLFIPNQLSAESPLNRDSDPVVLTGADLPELLGEFPDSIVAFCWNSDWLKIPVQIDERAVVDFGQIYNEPALGITFLAYTDSSTFTGVDPEPTFDSNDELVFMARDTGDPAPWNTPDPPGVIEGSRVRLLVHDPLGPTDAYLYLFIRDGTNPFPPDVPYVNYSFNLLSGNY